MKINEDIIEILFHFPLERVCPFTLISKEPFRNFFSLYPRQKGAMESISVIKVIKVIK